MKTILAKHSGFCSGVERSARLAESTCYKKPVYTWGPLIHNEQFVQYLEKKGVKKTENIKDIKDATIIVRSHGIQKNMLDNIRNNAFELVNGTCPNVTRVQTLAQKLEKNNYDIIIFGDINHPEIISIESFITKPYIVDSDSDIKHLPKLKKPALISQTTQSIDAFEKIVKLLTSKYPNIEIHNTICNATELRQKSAKTLASQVDMMIVIGGKKSSNTKKLFEVCKKIVTTHLVETKNDLKKNWFKNISVIGITAGASTPDWIIKEVQNYIEKI